MKDVIVSLSKTQKLLLALFTIYFVWIMGDLFIRHDHYLWDFRVYYSASKAYLLGLNPYNVDELFQAHQNVARLPYMYPPLVMYVFIPLALLNADLAAILYLALKVISLGALFVIWNKIVDFKKYLGLFVIFSFFAFNAAMHRDLITGNLTVFEQLAIWTGIYYFLKGKIYHFGALIVLVSAVKLLPIVFLGFLFFSDNKSKNKALLIYGIIFTFYLGANYILEPGHTSEYVHAFVSTDSNSIASNDHNDGGITNASSYEFMKALPRVLNVSMSQTIPIVLYAAFILFVLLYSWKKLSPIISTKDKDQKLMLVFSLSLAVLLILPRVKDYSFVLAVLPTFYLMLRLRHRDSFLVLLLLICLSVRNLSAPIYKEVLLFYWDYYTLILTGIVWWLLLREIGEGKKNFVE